MADYTNNLNLILPGDDDYTLVENLTDDYQAIDDFAGDVVKVYDPTTTHSKREYCIYQDHLYKCNSFITQPEAFDPSKWDRVILGDEVRNNNSYITNLQSGLAIVQDGDTATKAITQGQYVLWKSSMRYAKANIAIGETLSSTNLGTVTYENGALNRLSEQIGQEINNRIRNNLIIAYEYKPNIAFTSGTAIHIALTKPSGASTIQGVVITNYGQSYHAKYGVEIASDAGGLSVTSDKTCTEHLKIISFWT